MLSNHRQPHWRGYVTRTGNVAPAGISSKDLAVGSIGFFPVENKGGDTKSVSVINAQQTPYFKIGFGMPKSESMKYLHGNVGGTMFTDMIPAKGIKSLKVQKAKRLNGGSRGEIWTIGYDGIDASRSLTAYQGYDEKIIRVEMRGNPIAKAFGQYKQEFEFFLEKGCIPPSCTGICESCTDEEKKAIDANWLADQFIKQFNSYRLYGKHINDFVKVTKLRKSCPSQPAKTVACKSFIVTVPCDEGDATSLGRVQAQYPGFVVTLKSHSNSSKESVYEMWRTVEQGSPSNLLLKSISVPNCANACPVGYTKTSEAKVFSIVVPCGAVPNPVPGQISSTKIASTIIADTYEVITQLSTLESDVLTANPDCSLVKEIGVKQDICTSGEVSYSWVACKEAYKAAKDWRITLQDLVCEGCENVYSDRLADLQKKYPGLVISIESEGDCVHTYKTTTVSACEGEGCGEDVNLQAPKPEPFDRFMYWTEATEDLLTCPDCTTPAEVEPPCEAVGLKFETAVFNKLSNECAYGSFQWSQADVEPVMLNISIHSHSYTQSICEKDVKNLVRKVQEIAYERGQGSAVRELEYGWFSWYYTGFGFERDPVARQILGTVAVAQPDEFYDEIQLTYRASQHGEFITNYHSDTHEVMYRIYVKEGTGGAIVDKLNALVASLNNPEVPIVAY